MQKQRLEYLGTFLLSAFSAIVFFLLLIADPENPTSFITQGDGGAFYTPALANLSYLLHESLFPAGVDWSTHNGASDFFLRANVTIFYPPLIALLATLKVFSFNDATAFKVFFLALHAAISFFFLYVLGKKYLNFGFLQSIFFATFIIFGFAATRFIVFLPFYLACCLFPLAICAAIYASKIKSYFLIFLLSIIPFSYFFIGYLPLAMAGVSLSALFAIIYIYWLRPEDYPYKISATINAILPTIIAGIVALPTLLSIIKFVENAETVGMRGLTYAAFSIPQNMSDLISILSFSFPSPSIENFVVFGLFGLAVLFIYLMTLNKSGEWSQSLESRIIKFSIIMFMLMFMISYGEAFLVSALFYFLVPGLGEMHSYQRYFMFGYVFYGIVVTIAFNAILNFDNQRIAKFTALIFLLIAFFISFGVNLNFVTNPTIDWVYLIVHSLIVCFIFASIIIFSKPGAWITAIFFVAMMTLPYIYSAQKNYFVTNHILLDKNKHENDALISFFKNNSNKEIIKYANLTTPIYSYIPRNYPWSVKNEVNLSSYDGYDTHIGADFDYRAQHTTGFGVMNWLWLRKTGADFIIVDENSRIKYKDEIDKYTDRTTHFELSSGDSVLKLKPNFVNNPPGYSNDYYDNGYIRVLHAETKPEISKFRANAHEIKFRITVSNNNVQIIIPFWPNDHLKAKINNQKVTLPINDGLYFIDLAPGNYKIEIYYGNTWLNFGIYLSVLYYAMLVLISLGLIGLNVYYRRRGYANFAKKTNK